MNQITSTSDDLLQNIGRSAGFSIEPASANVEKRDLIRLPVDNVEKAQINALLQQIPLASVVSKSSSLYSVSFPDGLPESLVKLKQGGFGSMIIDPETKQFVGTASLTPIVNSSEALFLMSFSALSVVTGQYFLAEINNNLTIINQKLDKILEFLYGEKKAELLSEISFTKYSYSNYSSIIKNNEQRIATISGLQSTKKVAIKDIEFYINDLDSIVSSELRIGNDYNSIFSKAMQIYESINASIQLYATSSLLEVYYSQNFSKEYIDFVEAELSSYIEKCEKRALSAFSILRTRINDFKAPIPLPGSTDRAAILSSLDRQIDLMHAGNYAERYCEVRSVLRSMSKPINYFIDDDGNVYIEERA